MMLAAHLDERTKKFILVLCALLILLLLLFGFIYLIIDKYIKKRSKDMDNYMYPLLKYGIIKSRKQFLSALFYHEKRNFFNGSKWGFRLLILATSVAFGVVYICFEGSYSEFFSKVFDLFPKIKWQTIGEINETLIDTYPDLVLSGPEWMPASIFPSIISKNPDFSDPMLYCSMVYYLSIFCALVTLIKATLAFIARIRRGLLMSRKVFEKNLEKLDLDAVNTYSQAVNSQIPTQNDSNQGDVL